MFEGKAAFKKYYGHREGDYRVEQITEYFFWIEQTKCWPHYDAGE